MTGRRSSIKNRGWQMVGTHNVGAELVDQLTKGLEKYGKGQTDIQRFSNYFFESAEIDDLGSLSEEQLVNITIDAFDYIQTRPANAHKIRAYDISVNSENGEADTRTVIEVLNDDMPFLVDSIMGEIQDQHLNLFQIMHPIFYTERKSSGEMVALLEEEATYQDGLKNKAEGYLRESFIHIQIEAISDQRKKDLATTISNILENVRLAVADWRAMLHLVSRICVEYTENPPPVEMTDLSEAVDFLRWLSDNHFTFLGMRRYELQTQGEKVYLKPVQDSGLGVLRDPDIQVIRTGGSNYELSEQSRKFLYSPDPLMVTKANLRSNIHRRVHMDYIGVKIYSDDGEIIGELRIVGLFTSTAYTRAPKDVPLLRHKVETVIKRFGMEKSSHAGKALQNVLDTFPRDELFQIGADKLFETVYAVTRLDLQPKAKVFVRMDEFWRFASILVYVPRDTFSTDTRIKIADYLARKFNGRVSAVYPFIPEGPMVRIHYIIGLSGEVQPEYDEDDLSQNVALMLNSWRDGLKEELSKEHLLSKASNLLQKYGHAFPAGYEELVAPSIAIQDINRIERLRPDDPIAISFYKEDGAPEEEIRASIYHLGGPIPLTQRVPILENFGFSVIDERSFLITPSDEDSGETIINLHNMVLHTRNKESLDLEQIHKRLEDGFIAVWCGFAEDDQYNQLLTKVAINWREVAAIRALGQFLRQIGDPFSKRYLGQTLAKYPAVTNAIIELFRMRCNPDISLPADDRIRIQEELIDNIEYELSEIPSLDEDRILRHYLDLTKAILRTNFYQLSKDKIPLETIAFKFDSRNIEAIPNPKPYAEIFVYSPRVEGVHLRGGKIARGGLRWSDRKQDFRTEVLGLAKAQQVKNTVIVPTGAKGGFVPKKLSDNASREERQAEGVECYKLFINSLLTITDNISGQEIIRPERVICYDQEDPYLVVAADKGTATFSDIANQISQENKFWLDDAFASGGSAGYDHKKMGITARGAWESVKRHFREMDRDIQTEEFTVIGVGDMSGDVFGNGMILSKATRLLAAFDHRDIFIDPNPTQERAWFERKRLFEMDRSSWQNYNRDIISKGGGVFSRDAKSIELTDEIRELTGLRQDKVTPNQLIHAILKVQADLLWFGGIGTYICADNERDEEVGDRANDAIRIKASELHVKVVGEGANLGMTQKARIEFAMRGGRLNTDAIDNSAGVNSSDLEVNIKIVLGELVRNEHMSLKERDALLAKMTDEVAIACLKNNYLQSLTISLGQRRGLDDLSFQKRLMNELERKGLLNRKLEDLPSDTEIKKRARTGQPMTRPELAVLLAYSKIDLFNQLIESSVPDDEFLVEELLAYFPETLRRDIPDALKEHRLRREIIATQLSNAIINRGGSTMIIRIREETGYRVADIAYAFVAARAVFDLEEIYAEIDSLDTKISGDLQLSMYAEIQNLLRAQTKWFLHNIDLSLGLSNVISTYKNGLELLDQSVNDVMSPFQISELQNEIKKLEEQGVSKNLAAYIASLTFLSNGPDMILSANNTDKTIKEASVIYCEIERQFRLDDLRKQAIELGHGDYFDRIAVNSALQDISEVQRSISEEILESEGEITDWIDDHSDAVERAQQLISDILRADELSIAKLTVAVSHLRQLC